MKSCNSSSGVSLSAKLTDISPFTIPPSGYTPPAVGWRCVLEGIEGIRKVTFSYNSNFKKKKGVSGLTSAAGWRELKGNNGQRTVADVLLHLQFCCFIEL